MDSKEESGRQKESTKEKETKGELRIYKGEREKARERARERE